MAEPFQTRAGRGVNRLPGLAGGSRKRAFLAELENELARAERVTQVDPSRVTELAKEKGVDLDQDCPTPRRRLYRRFLEYCLDDHALSEDESQDLSHLKVLLHLRNAEAQSVHDEVARSIYGQAMDVVLEDCRLDPEEEQFLQNLRQQIGITEESADEVRREGAERAKQRFLERAMVHGSAFVAQRGVEIELEGSSASGFQEAVEAAFDAAPDTLGRIRSAELKTLRVDVAERGERRWSVILTTRL